MSKRHLTQQQRRRIQGKQAAVINHSAPGGQEQSGLVLACYGKQADVEVLGASSGRRVIRCHLRTNLDSVVCGDQVRFLDEEGGHGVIIAVEQRHSVLLRPDKYRKLKAIASNVSQLLIVIAPEPEPFTNLIDRYLVAAHACHVRPILFLNKTDQLSSITNFLEEFSLTIYQKLAYPLLTGSADHVGSLAPLHDILRNQTSVFVGQSGVGKSSLINALLPDAQQQTAALSEIGKGSHTTTSAQLLHLHGGGDVIDSPGIREFGLWHLEPEKIQDGFVELNHFATECKFRNCKHQGEPHCAVELALKNGGISHERFNSFLSIQNEMTSHQADQY